MCSLTRVLARKGNNAILYIYDVRRMRRDFDVLEIPRVRLVDK